MKKSQLRSIFILFICVLLIGGFIYYVVSNAAKYLQLLQISFVAVVILFIVSLIFPAINGIINTYLFRSMGANLSHRDGFLLAAVTTLANQLPVSGGIIVKGIYIKHKYHISYTRYMSATIALFICFLSVNGFIGILILFYWMIFSGKSIPVILLIGFGAMAASLTVFWLPLDRLKLPGKIKSLLNDALEGWGLIIKSPFLIVKQIGLQASLTFLLAIQYWIAFHMLSQNVTYAQTTLFSAASVLNLLISIAPGGLGITESIVGGVASTLGFDVVVSIIAVGLYRLVSTISVILIGSLSVIVLERQISADSIDMEKQKIYPSKRE